MDELLAQFLIEGRELTQQAAGDLLAIEAAPNDPAALDGAFRAIHTLKGSVGLFDFAPLGRVLHAAEDVMGEMRAGRLAAGRAGIDGLLAAIGLTERWLSVIESTGRLPPDAEPEAGRHVAQLRAQLGAEPQAAPAAGNPEDADWIASLLEGRASAEPLPDGVLTAVRYTPDADCYFRGEDPLAIVKATPGIVALRIRRRDTAAAGADYDPFRCELVFELLAAAPLAEVKAVFRLVGEEAEFKAFTPSVQAAAPQPASPPPVQESSRTLRVDATRVDALADIVDDLVVLKNGLADLAAQAAAGLDIRATAEALSARQAALDRLVSRLHRTVTSIRLLPVLPLLRRFPRIVREIGRSLGKDVELYVEGHGVEADKAVVDGLFDPLTHLVRNAVDHGVEPAEARRRAGKPERAQLSLTARREGEKLVVELHDDGRGIDPAAIRDAAVRRGVASPTQVEAMSDAEALDLVFRPGFSTAEEVTQLSGRGVGMDAVRAAVGRLGGTATLSSTPGAGTSVRLVLPLSIVLTRVVVVVCGGELYGVPVDDVLETARVSADRTVAIRGGSAILWRDRPTPLLHLRELLGGERVVEVAAEFRVLVLRIGADQVALAVDAILEPRDLSLRPMTGLLSGMRGVAGSALLGNGQVLLVLDVGGLIG